MGALAIGLIAGVICYGAVCLKPFFKYDDSLDAFGVHGIGGFLGAILTGIFAREIYTQAGAGNTTAVGVLAGGIFGQVKVQLLACLVSVVFAFVVTYLLVLIIDRVWGFALDDRSEMKASTVASMAKSASIMGQRSTWLPSELPGASPCRCAAERIQALFRGRGRNEAGNTQRGVVQSMPGGLSASQA